MQVLAVLAIYALIYLLCAAYIKYTHDNFKK
jgi:hypothetical protein